MEKFRGQKFGKLVVIHQFRQSFSLYGNLKQAVKLWYNNKIANSFYRIHNNCELRENYFLWQI